MKKIECPKCKSEESMIEVGSNKILSITIQKIFGKFVCPSCLYSIWRDVAGEDWLEATILYEGRNYIMEG